MALSKLVLFVMLLCYAVFNVEAHAWMSNPAPRGQYTDPKKRPDLEYKPSTTNNDPNESDFICRSDPPIPVNDRKTYTAGQTINVTISYNARHPGDCFMYMTYDGDKPYDQMKWFKIWEQHECYKYDWNMVTIPSYLPSAAHAILRWEWYALHVMDQGRGPVEFYTQCVDVKIMGFNGGQLPQPQVSIPGHLPRSGGNNYWDPYNGGPMFFTGPPVARLTGATPTTTPIRVTDAPTTRPTSPPPAANTVRPTPAPPAPTPAATPKPSATGSSSTGSTTGGKKCKPKKRTITENTQN